MNYGSGNVKSVYNVLTYLGYDAHISNQSELIREASHIILPGVGAFGAAMDKIMERIDFKVLEEVILDQGKPFLGICVGMQLLADLGREYGEHRGFGWIAGEVDKLPVKTYPLPHIGWNDIVLEKECPLFKDFGDYRDFYFVHSYAFNVQDPSYKVASTEYEAKFCSVVQKENVFGIQFHPEKSQKAGQLLLKNFIELT